MGLYNTGERENSPGLHEHLSPFASQCAPLARSLAPERAINPYFFQELSFSLLPPASIRHKQEDFFLIYYLLRTISKLIGQFRKPLVFVKWHW